MSETPDVIDLNEIREALRDERPLSIQRLFAERTDHEPLQLDLFRLSLAAKLSQVEEGNSYGGSISGSGGLDAPWTPVPLYKAEAFIASNKRYALEIIFPTVFEEDRSIKIKDIATAQGLDYSSHQWAAEQVAKELGREDFNYKQEIAQIKVERETLPPPPAMPGEDLGVDPNAPPGTPPSASMPKPGFTQTGIPQSPDRLPAIAPSDEEAPGKRGQLSAPVVADFKRQQRQSTRQMRRLITHLGTLTESTLKIAEQLQNLPPSSVTVTPPPVVIPPAVVVPPAQPGDVTVRNEIIMPDAPVPEPPTARTFEIIERDVHGFAKTFRERYLPKDAV